MSMDLFVARTMITKASLVYKGAIDITENQVIFLIFSLGFSFVFPFLMYLLNAEVAHVIKFRFSVLCS